MGPSAYSLSLGRRTAPAGRPDRDNRSGNALQQAIVCRRIPQPNYMTSGPEKPPVRHRLSRWKRAIAPHSFALDHLSALVRYRPFNQKDLSTEAHGYLADVLATGRLFVPKAASFNDPWEAAPALEPVWWQRDAHRQVAEFLAFMAKTEHSAKSYEELLAATRSFDVNVVLAQMQKHLLGVLRQGPILSLSDRADNLLMWSYYGQGHNGYALVFDTQTMPFAAAVKVRYSRRHPRILLNRRDMGGIATDVLGTKARQWAHEREWRIIVSSTHATKLGFTAFESAGPPGYFGCVPKHAIVGVVVGNQLYEGPDGKSVMEMLEEHSPRLRVWLAEVQRREFQIRLRPVRFSQGIVALPAA